MAPQAGMREDGSHYEEGDYFKITPGTDHEKTTVFAALFAAFPDDIPSVAVLMREMKQQPEHVAAVEFLEELFKWFDCSGGHSRMPFAWQTCHPAFQGGKTQLSDGSDVTVHDFTSTLSNLFGSYRKPGGAAAVGQTAAQVLPASLRRPGQVEGLAPTATIPANPLIWYLRKLLHTPKYIEIANDRRPTASTI